MRFSNFDTREVGKRQNMLLVDFTYIDDVYGAITATSGFITNYASLDKLKNLFLFVLYALLAGYGNKSSTIHDYLYNRGGYTDEQGVFHSVSRYEADRIFYRALRAEGVAKWRAWIFYTGVRAFGSSRYLKPSE
mgnify:FL=1